MDRVTQALSHLVLEKAWKDRGTGLEETGSKFDVSEQAVKGDWAVSKLYET